MSRLDQFKESRDISKEAYNYIKDKETVISIPSKDFKNISPVMSVEPPVKPKLNLYKGGWYKTRDGRKVKLTKRRCFCSSASLSCGIEYPWAGKIYNTCKGVNKKSMDWCWNRKGTADESYYGFECPEKDLIEEIEVEESRVWLYILGLIFGPLLILIGILWTVHYDDSLVAFFSLLFLFSGIVISSILLINLSDGLTNTNTNSLGPH